MIGTTNGPDEYFTTFFLPIALFGMGLGLSFAPLTVAALASAPADNAGIASGVNSTMSRAGQVLIIGILGGLAISWFAQLLMDAPTIKALPAEAQTMLAADAGDMAETAIPDTLSDTEQESVRQVLREAFAATFSILMWIGAALCLISALIAYVFIEDYILIREEDVEDMLVPA